uniref:uncharacterized protein LOC122583146 n=1 Tax=Erigeron canadensis TaxID=72917 RepID=UPI001CB9C75E|nr:uncharacterized protein LOC122583146 [Erigeron canadensis]
MLSKWFWRYKNEPDALWRKVIDALHVSNRSWNSVPVKASLSGVRKTIVGVVDKFKVEERRLPNLFKGVCGNGDNIRFWLDNWISDVCLKDLFPSIFKMEKNKKYVQGWYSMPLNGDMINEWISFRNLVDVVRLSDDTDKCVWLSDSNERFSVKSAKDFVRSKTSVNGRFVFKWAKGVPKECNIFMWRTSLNRIPTYKALQVPNCNFGSTLCGLCNSWDETIEHILCHCHVAASIWDHISMWCKVDSIFVSSVKDIIELSSKVNLDKKSRKVFKCIVFVTRWCLWKARNEKVFDNATITIEY